MTLTGLPAGLASGADCWRASPSSRPPATQWAVRAQGTRKQLDLREQFECTGELLSNEAGASLARASWRPTICMVTLAAQLQRLLRHLRVSSFTFIICTLGRPTGGGGGQTGGRAGGHAARRSSIWMTERHTRKMNEKAATGGQ